MRVGTAIGRGLVALRHQLAWLGAVAVILSCITVGLITVQMRADDDERGALDTYLRESDQDTLAASSSVQARFSQVYQALRTIARLPSIKQVDRRAQSLDRASRLTVQEIFNNLLQNVAVSEVAIVPADFDPTSADPGKPKFPIASFDHLIVGKEEGPSNQATANKIEVKKFEYALFRRQLDWMRALFPAEEAVEGLKYPAVTGPEVLTSDHSDYSSMRPRDADRSGIVYSVPFYGEDGELHGCVSAVILSTVIASWLPSDHYGLLNTANGYEVRTSGSGFGEKGPSAKSDSSVYVAEGGVPLRIADDASHWQLSYGVPRSEFESRSDVQILRTRAKEHRILVVTIGLGILLIVALLERLRGFGDRRRIDLAREDEANKAASQLEKVNAELTEALAQQKLLTEQAQTGDKAKSEFLANMSHEIRTPLNGVMGMADLLLETKLDPNQADFAQTIKTAAANLVQVVNDILDFSKIAAGKMEIEKVETDLLRLATDAIHLMAPLARCKGLDLRLDVDESTSLVYGDPTRLMQIFLNLLGNAIKFTQEGWVELKIGPDPNRISWTLISVRDTGIGISTADQSRLFSSFTQADSSTTREYGGTGLGLAISQQLASLMGGSISLTSNLGHGSTFTVEVPLARRTQPAEAPKQDRTIKKRTRNDPLRGLAVLLVEDNPVNQKVAVKMLQSLGVEVSLAGNGLEAIQLLDQMPFDLVLMDCHMPELDGFGATHRIRSSTEAYCTIPIIALTACAVEGDRERCLEAGMDAYLSKPFSLRDLEQILIEQATSAAA